MKTNGGRHTTSIHAGIDPKEHRGAVSVPIYQSSTFAVPTVEEAAARFEGKSNGLLYTRVGNPTVQALEEAIAELERGAGAVATATGMAAVSTVLLAMLRTGDHVVATDPLYGATIKMLQSRLTRFGITATFVHASDTAGLRKAIRPETRLIVVETPANPTLDLVDLDAAAKAAHAAGIHLVVDNTFAGPHLQRPIELGADIVVHSATKSLNGHADVVGGAIVTADPSMLKTIREAAIAFGTTMDPHQAWLVLRGIRTLGMRVERAQANALALAKWLEAQPGVERVRYPGLASHPQYALARKQMDGPGAVVSFEVNGGAETARALLNSVRVITLAVSLGGVESLVEHPASMTHHDDPEIAQGLIRLAVGCEDLDDLRADLAQAIAHAFDERQVRIPSTE